MTWLINVYLERFVDFDLDYIIKRLHEIIIKDNGGKEDVYDMRVVLEDDEAWRSHKKTFYKVLDDELLRVAWHPSRAIDWCFDEDEKSLLNELLE